MKYALVCLCLGIGLSGCGQKGPLYLPQSQQPNAPQKQQAPVQPANASSLDMSSASSAASDVLRVTE